MLVLIIFIFTDIFIVGICTAVYCRKPEYTDRMLLGVHIPPYAVHDKEVEELIKRYHILIKRFGIINWILSIAVCFLNLWYMSIFIIFWTLWLLEFVAGVQILQFGTHRKLYDIKVKRGWQGASSEGIVVVDTSVSAESDRLSFSIWWHTPAFVIMLTMGLLPSVRDALLREREMWIVAGISLFMSLFFTIMHYFTARIQNEVFSQNSKINKCVNQTTKRVWSMVWLVGNYLNQLSLCVFFYYTVKTQWISGLGIAWFVIIQSMAGVGILGGLLFLRWKKQDLLKEDTDRIYLDDDVYWKNGWYCNPNSHKMWVQDRMNCMSYTVNMGRPGGKIYMGTAIGIAVAVVAGLSAFFLEMDFTPRYLKAEGNKVFISAPAYPLSFEKSDVKTVELLPDIPKGDWNRTNGLDDGKQLVGKFKERDIGQCRLYIYQGYSPVLKIELEEYTVFINSKHAKQTEEWHELLVR